MKNLTRRKWMGASVAGAGLLGAAASSPLAEGAPARPAPTAKKQGRRIIDSHVHLWKLPRANAPMSDLGTFPTGCCGSVPWMEVDRLPADYDARVGGPKVDKVV